MQAVLFSPDIDEADVFRVMLQQAGFMVRVVRSLDHAIEAWPENPADLILIVLSGEHSKSLVQIKQLRAYTAVPILLIAELLSEELFVRYLDSGADIVILRPYRVRGVLAQIRAIMRRSGGLPAFSLPTLTQREVHLDPSDRTVRINDGAPKRLTQLEFRLLYTLMTHIGQIIPPEQIVEHVWGYSGEGNRELVRGLVQRLRSKVEPDPRKPRYILTESGIGYKFSKS